jgi:hypothetical protein
MASSRCSLSHTYTALLLREYCVVILPVEVVL